MAGNSDTRATTDHNKIRAWAEQHDGVPSTVRATKTDGEPGVLTLDILGYGADEEDLEHIDWDTWFEKFEESDLAFLYQHEKTNGEDSTFFKLVDRRTVDAG